MCHIAAPLYPAEEIKQIVLLIWFYLFIDLDLLTARDQGPSVAVKQYMLLRRWEVYGSVAYSSLPIIRTLFKDVRFAIIEKVFQTMIAISWKSIRSLHDIA